MNRTPLYLLGAAIVVGGLAYLTFRSHRVATDGLPTRIECKGGEAEALALAGPRGIPILGTGSMAPFIPPAPKGKNPKTTVVAYAVMESAASYSDIQAGDLCIYQPEWHVGLVIHQAVKRDGLGWIMSGLNNPRSESGWRVTSANFRGIVARVYVWP